MLDNSKDIAFDIRVKGVLSKRALNDILPYWTAPFNEDLDTGLYIIPSVEQCKEDSVSLQDQFLGYASNARAVGGSLVVIAENKVEVIDSGEFMTSYYMNLFKGKVTIAFTPGRYAGDMSDGAGQLLADAIAGQLKTMELLIG